MATEKPLNVILIGIDALRYDHLGYAGYSKNTSPHIDNLAKASLVFHNCYSQAPTTGPSFASLLTSRYPTFHGIMHVWTKNRGWKLAENIPTLQEILKSKGYATVAFTEGGALLPNIGLTKGFDVYETTPYSLTDAGEHPAVRWIEQNGQKPFFLFFHTYATHGPYVTPTTHIDMQDPNYHGSFPANIAEILQKSPGAHPFRQLMENVKHVPEEIERLQKMYDACIVYMDTFVGQFMEKLRAWGMDENTIVIFTSDHGEEFMEHGHIYHVDVYDEVLHIPLLIKTPSTKTRKNINQIVRSIDIMPTILDILNVETEETFQGTSLLPALEGVDLDLVALAEHGHSKFSLRNKYYKYIFRGKAREELYNIVSDPHEKNDLSKYSLPLVEKLHNEFQDELTSKKLVRPPHKMFILGKEVTLETQKLSPHFEEE